MTLPMILSDLKGHFRYYKRLHCLHLKNAACPQSITTVVRHKDYCRLYSIGGQLYDAERGLLAIAKFLLVFRDVGFQGDSENALPGVTCWESLQRFHKPLAEFTGKGDNGGKGVKKRKRSGREKEGEDRKDYVLSVPFDKILDPRH